MNLSEIIETGAKIQLITTPADLSSFAIEIAEKTAQKIVTELHQPDTPLTESEACKLWGKTRQTFSKYRKQGKIRYHRIGGSILYYPSELSEDLKKL